MEFGGFDRDRARAMPARRRARHADLSDAFGARVRAARLKSQMTQEQLAEAASVHPTFVSNLERGYSAPTLHTLLKVAKALGVRPGELVDGLEPGDD